MKSDFRFRAAEVLLSAVVLCALLSQVCAAEPYLRTVVKEGGKVVYEARVGDEDIMAHLVSLSGVSVPSEAVALLADVLGVPLSSCEWAIVKHKPLALYKNPGYFVAARRGDLWAAEELAGIATVLLTEAGGVGIHLAAVDNSLEPRSEKTLRIGQGGEPAFGFAVLIFTGDSIPLLGESLESKGFRRVEKIDKAPSLPQVPLSAVKDARTGQRPLDADFRAEMRVEQEGTLVARYSLGRTTGGCVEVELEGNTRYWVRTFTEAGVRSTWYPFGPGGERIYPAQAWGVVNPNGPPDGLESEVLSFSEAGIPAKFLTDNLGRLPRDGVARGGELRTGRAGYYHIMYGVKPAARYVIRVYRYPGSMQR